MTNVFKLTIIVNIPRIYQHGIVWFDYLHPELVTKQAQARAEAKKVIALCYQVCAYQNQGSQPEL